jgi:hypothetical protein
MEERVTHTREARGSLQLRHNETVSRLGTTQQELVGDHSSSRGRGAQRWTDRSASRRATSEGPGNRGYPSAAQLQRGHGTRSSLEISSADGGSATTRVATLDHPGLFFEQYA